MAKEIKISSKLLLIAVLAVTCGGLGWVLNGFRKTPLPLVYQSKASRFEEQNFLPKQPDLPKGIRYISLGEFQREVKNGALALDARPEIFYRLGHIPGAQSLPREDFSAGFERLRPVLEKERDRLLIVYCAGDDCEDSKLVAEGLGGRGFPQIAIFTGGWHLWSNSGLTSEAD